MDSFKGRFLNHTKLFNLKKYESNTSRQNNGTENTKQTVQHRLEYRSHTQHHQSIQPQKKTTDYKYWTKQLFYLETKKTFKQLHEK